MSPRIVIVLALALAAFAAPASFTSRTTTGATGKGVPNGSYDLKNLRRGTAIRESNQDKSPASPLAPSSSSPANGASSLSFPRTNTLPEGVIYDPVMGFALERLQTRDSLDAPIRVAENGDVDIHAALRKLKMHVPGDAPQEHMPVLSHQIDLSDTAAVSLNTDVIRVWGPKSFYKLVVDSSMPPAERDAFARAVYAWARVFPSPVEIRIRLSWTDLGGTTLGITAVPFYIPGSIQGANNLKDNTAYGSVLANALEGRDFIPESEVHIVMGFSSGVPWNTGKNEASLSEWDLETAALHEMGHGLFFSGTVQAIPSESVAEFAFRNNPARFDRFLSDGASGNGLAACAAPRAIFNTITGRNLRFIDPNNPGNTNFGLYSPPSFNPSATAYHFDPDVLSLDCLRLGISSADCSDLMTQNLPNGYTQRTIGKSTERIMNAMLGRSGGYTSAQSCVWRPTL